MSRDVRLVAVLFVACFATALQARGDEVDASRVREAVQRAIPLLERAAAGSADQRQCFTCHHQAVPVFALVEARRSGFEIDSPKLDRQVQHTADHLKRGQENYSLGKGQGGAVLTAGYALWTLAAAKYGPDETTAVVAHYLLEYQKDQPHYEHRGSRPPSSGSDFTASYVALRGLSDYAKEDQRVREEARREQIRNWVLATEARDTEDRVFRLLTLDLLSAETAEQEEAKQLLSEQQEDGGWAQLPGMNSDAYATATALYALLTVGSVGDRDESVQRGVKYLVETQLEDGSWHVVTRAEGFQAYFETGFPHGRDQFISAAASGWATLVLARLSSEVPQPASAEAQ